MYLTDEQRAEKIAVFEKKARRIRWFNIGVGVVGLLVLVLILASIQTLLLSFILWELNWPWEWGPVGRFISAIWFFWAAAFTWDHFAKECGREIEIAWAGRFL